MLLTGADPEEARRAQRAGAAALVHKPFSPLDLLAVVERVSGRTPVPRRPRRAKPADQELVLYARDLRHLLDVERGQRALLEESYLATVTSLAGALESRDTRTGAHSQRVQRYAIELLELIDPGRVEQRARTAVRVPAARHRQDRDPRRDPAEAGPVDPRRAAADADAHGARRADARRRRGAAGRGPARRALASRALGRRGLSGRARRGRAFRSRARVFAVADALDAMTSDRPYRRKLKWAAAHDEILAQSGKQFDPAVVDAFREREPVLREAQRELAAA